MNQPRKLFLIALQVVLWTAFLSLPYFMMPHQIEEARLDAFARHYFPNPDMAENIFLSSLALNICLIAFFYLHQYFIFNRFILPKKFAAYFGLVTAIFIIIFFTSLTFRRTLFPSAHAYRQLVNVRDVVRVGTWYLLVLFVSLGIKLLGQWRLAEQRTKEIETEQLRTELSFLHAQINPHFLFNSLNTIYSLALKKSDVAPGAILKLSQLLRYVVDEASRENVLLSMEINYLNNYLELQKLRSASNVVVRFNVTGPIESATIAPLLLLPFVENAFKYGISNSAESPIDISVEAEDKLIRFKISNQKFNSEGFGDEKYSTGIGIANVRRRLDLLYPAKYTLNIDDNGNFYFVQLTLQST